MTKKEVEHAKRQENQVVYSEVHQGLLQSPAVSASGAAFCRRAYGHTTAAERQQQQQRGRRRGRGQSGARASSDDFSDVRISSGASCSNLRWQLWSLPLAPRVGFILVPCGHARCCESCVIGSHYFRLTKHFTIVGLIYSKIHAQITKKTITKW